VAALTAACGGGSKPADDKKVEAKAADTKVAPVDEAVAKRKAERLAKEQAVKDAEAKKQEQIKALAQLPATLPKKLDKACDEVAKVQDAFMQRMFPDQAAKLAAGKAKQMADTKTACMGTGSIEVAACQAKALTDAPEELRKEIPALLIACIEKYGTKPAG
jgi:hypothetical protein